MSSSVSAAPIHLEPGPSSRLHAMLVALYALVGTGLLLALPPAGAIPAVALGALLLWRDRRSNPLPARIVCTTEGDWWLDRSGPFELQPATVVTPWLVVLVLHGPDGTRRLPLLADTLSPPQWRRLRAHLRIAARPD